MTCSWIGRFNIIKASVLPKLIYIFNAIPNMISKRFLVKLHNLTLKNIRKCKQPKIAKIILKKKSKIERLTHPTFKT